MVPCHFSFMRKIGPRTLLVVMCVCLGTVPVAGAESLTTDLTGWAGQFAFHYDYTVVETAGLARRFEPVEVTLSVPGSMDAAWRDHIRVVLLDSDTRGVPVVHQALDPVTSDNLPAGNEQPAAPAQSVNVVFLTDCPAHGRVNYRLYWGLPEKGAESRAGLPSVEPDRTLRVSGEAPGLEISNEYYDIRLDPKSGAVLTAKLAARPDEERLFYHSIPIHFGTDIWSPPQSWDHDYDWTAPPHEKAQIGPIAVRYHRWGPMQKYPDVQSSITYTFYAHVPYVHVSSTFEFTANRSARAVRMGEIVVAHSHREGPNEKDADGKSPDIFTHYAWPGVNGRPVSIELNAHREAQGAANVEDFASGALGVLDRDVPWVAGYHADKKYGLATLRRAQFAGNRLGGAVPHSAPCTMVANYGWGFSYWSRPMVYPPGLKGTPEDQNTVVATGTVFAIEEALLFFEYDGKLKKIGDAQHAFAEPLKLDFKGTGPW